MTYDSLFRPAAVIAAIFLLAGCSESRLPTPTGKGAVRGINGIVTAPELNFLNEERSLENVGYLDVSGFREWDDLDYTFNFDYFPPYNNERERIASHFVDVVPDTEYTIVLTGTMANPTLVTWDTAERTWAGTETVFEMDIAHLSPALGQVDVYFDLVGIAPVVGMEVGTLSFGERIPHQEFAEGDYVVTLTAPGDPATVLYESIVVGGTPQQRTTLGIFDPDPSKTAPVSVTLYFQSGASQTLADTRFPQQVRILHAWFGTPNFDGYLDEGLATLVYQDVAYKAASQYVDVPDIVTPLTLTEAGNSGNVLYETELQRFLNNRRTLTPVSLPDTVGTRPLDDAARPLETYPVVRITHMSANLDLLNIYEVDPGTVIDDNVSPKFFGAQLGVTTEFFAADSTGQREFVVTLLGEQDPVSLPLVLDLEVGDFVDVAIVDTADPAVVELHVFDSNL